MHQEQWPNIFQFLFLRKVLCVKVSILMQCTDKESGYVLVGSLSFGINSTKLNGCCFLYKVGSCHDVSLFNCCMVMITKDLVMLAI